MTREQINGMYRAKMQALANKVAKDRQDAMDRERKEFQDRQNTEAKLYGLLKGIGVGQSIGERVQAKLMRDTFEVGEGVHMPKYIYRDQAKITEAGKMLKRFFDPKSELKYRPEYREKVVGEVDAITAKAWGKLGETEKLRWELNEETGKYESTFDPLSLFPEETMPGREEDVMTAKEYEKLVQERSAGYEEEEYFDLRDVDQPAAREVVPGVKTPVFSTEKYGPDGTYREELLKVGGPQVRGDEVEAPPITEAPIIEVPITPERSEELIQVLAKRGITLPAAMSEENKIGILTALDKVAKEKGVGEYEYTDRESWAFSFALKKGLDNPDMMPSVFTDLTENTDQTIQAVIDGTYTPEVEDISTVTETTGLGEIEEWEADLGIGESFTTEEIENMPAPARPTLVTEATLSEYLQEGDVGTGFTPEEELDYTTGAVGTSIPPPTPRQQAILALERKDTKFKEIPSKFWQVGGQSPPDLLTPKTTPTVKPDPELEKALREMETGVRKPGFLKKLLQTVTPGGEKGFFERGKEVGRPTAGISGDVFDVTGKKLGAPDVEVPDADPGLLRKAFKTGQTVLQLKNIGETITNKDATNEEKGIASLQGTKLLADIVAKQAGQKTASEIGLKALTKKGYAELTKEGVKQTGKQAVGTVAGGAIGGYTMVTEAKEAGEAWEEEDYDEAILHGIGSASGGLQTAGAGMMLSGVGAPLGAVLYGIGTAGSLISGAGLFLEGLFEGGPAQPETPEFDAIRYFESLRQAGR